MGSLEEEYRADENVNAGNERLPTEIGWTRRPTVMQSSEREKFTRDLKEAAGV